MFCSGFASSALQVRACKSPPTSRTARPETLSPSTACIGRPAFLQKGKDESRPRTYWKRWGSPSLPPPASMWPGSSPPPLPTACPSLTAPSSSTSSDSGCVFTLPSTSLSGFTSLTDHYHHQRAAEDKTYKREKHPLWNRIVIGSDWCQRCVTVSCKQWYKVTLCYSTLRRLFGVSVLYRFSFSDVFTFTSLHLLCIL